MDFILFMILIIKKKKYLNNSNDAYFLNIYKKNMIYNP